MVVGGVGMNFNPRPRRDLGLSGGTVDVVRSWKARLVGLSKNCEAGMSERRTKEL